MSENFSAYASSNEKTVSITLTSNNCDRFSSSHASVNEGLRMSAWYDLPLSMQRLATTRMSSKAAAALDSVVTGTTSRALDSSCLILRVRDVCPNTVRLSTKADQRVSLCD